MTVLLPAHLHAQDPVDPMEMLEERVNELVIDARFADAVEVARDLFDLVKDDPEAKTYQVADAERVLEMLEYAVCLPESARQELALSYGLDSVMVAYYGDGRYTEGAVVAERQLEIRRRLLGDAHMETILALNNVATFLEIQGDYSGAEPLYREALAIETNILGEEHPKVAVGLNNLAALLMDQGDYAAAEPLLREALGIKMKLFGKEHPDVAVGLNNLADLLQAKGNYAGAELLFREALAMWRMLLGDQHPNVAVSLNNLATLLMVQGDYAAAEPLLREALGIKMKLFGKEHPDVAVGLNNLAMLLYKQGDYAPAEALLGEALAMRRKLLDEEHPEVALSLRNLAILREVQGNFAGAESLCCEALAIQRKLLGEEHPQTAVSLNNLAGLLRAQGDYAGAEPLHREGLAIRRKLLGEEHPEVAQSLYNLACLLQNQGDYAGAESLLTQAAYVYDAARLRAGGGYKRSRFLPSPYTKLAIARLVIGRVEAAWPAAEKALGRSLADLLISAGQRRLGPAEAAREDSLKEALGRLERKLAAYHEAARNDSTATARDRVSETRNQLLAAEAKWSGFQREIVQKYPVTEGQAFPLERVQASLARETALVGWLYENTGEYEDQNHGAGIKSWGYIIRNSGPVHWVALSSPEQSTEGPSGPDATEVWTFRSKLTVAARFPIPVRKMTGIVNAAYALWKQWFSPLTPYLDQVEHLVVLPSNPMLGIPIEALTDANGTCMSDRYAVSYAPSATLYTWLREQGNRPSSASSRKALLVGDPPFTKEHLAAMERKDAELLVNANDPASAMHLVAGNTLRASDMGNLLAGNEEALSQLQRLPWASEEVKQVAALMPESSVLVGPDASEQELVQMAESGELSNYDVIHLATHALIHDERPERSALVLSQVDLPDALEAAEKGKRIYDGLLSAKEILQEWDLDADLVTLSACQSGLGRETPGEGYIGLASAFLQAGARSLLVSLWHVDDRATGLLMGRFYENLTGVQSNGDRASRRRPMSKATALQEAKRWLRNYREDDGSQPYRHPAYWSAFILIGEA